MNLDEYRARFSEDGAPGWDAIDERLHEVYGDQKPKHWGTALGYVLGGPDPLDGCSRYDCAEGGALHHHFVSYGFSSLYFNEEAFGGEWSGYGFELTFRLRPWPEDGEESVWPFSLMQNIARYVFETGKTFAHGHWMPANGPIRLDTDTQIRALLFVNDPVLGKINTPHGRLEFIQMVGITQREVDLIMEKQLDPADLIRRLVGTDPLMATDLSRTETPSAR